MATSLPLRCSCGNLRAQLRDVTPERVNRVVCGCRSCQTYAHRLGRAEEILDEYGGTHVFQASPAQLVFTAGHAHLACLQQTRKGALRWYASCCESPIANTLPAMNVPFMAIMCTMIDREQLDTPLDEVLGPLRATVNSKQIPKERRKARKATRLALLKMLFRYAPMILRWRWRGAHKHSPFFEPTTGRPVIEPRAVAQLEAPGPEPELVPRRAGCG